MEDVICRMAQEQLGVPEWVAHSTFWLLWTVGTLLGGQKVFQGVWRLLGGKPDSPAMKAILEALASPLARYDVATRTLVCPGARITFAADAKEGVSGAVVCDVAGDGKVQLIDALEGNEWVRAERMAMKRRDEVRERDRQLANERLAASIRSSAVEGLEVDLAPELPQSSPVAPASAPSQEDGSLGHKDDPVQPDRPVCALPSGQVLTVGNRKGKLYLAVGGKPVMTFDPRME